MAEGHFNFYYRMNISKKIEEIRNKPEHIRMQYVWGAVLVSMIFIFIIWLFSIKTLIQSKNPGSDAKFEQLTNKIQEMKENTPSSTQPTPEGFGNSQNSATENDQQTEIDSIDNLQQ